MNIHPTKLALLINALVALLEAGAALVLLLIAPLGLATVATLTLLIGLGAFLGGLLGDVLLLSLLTSRPKATQPQLHQKRMLLPRRD